MRANQQHNSTAAMNMPAAESKQKASTAILQFSSSVVQQLSWAVAVCCACETRGVQTISVTAEQLNCSLTFKMLKLGQVRASQVTTTTKCRLYLLPTQP
jgi:hypothetical protein